MPSHDESLAGDTLSTVELNYRWRRYITLALEERFRREIDNLTGAEADDFIQVWDALMQDIDD